MVNLDQISKYSNWKDRWDNQKAISILDYISFNIHPDDVIIISRLLFPKFIEIKNCILYSEKYDQNNFEDWCRELNNDSVAIEKVINHIHMYDLFAHTNETIKDSSFKEIGKLLQFSWALYLRSEFPSKRIIVDYFDNEKDYGPTITVYTET